MSDKDHERRAASPCDPCAFLAVAASTGGEEVALVVASAVGSGDDVVEDGRIARIVEGLAAEMTERVGGDQSFAEHSVLAVAWDWWDLVVGAA
jgi:hypothetical protein